MHLEKVFGEGMDAPACGIHVGCSGSIPVCACEGKHEIIVSFCCHGHDGTVSRIYRLARVWKKCRFSCFNTINCFNVTSARSCPLPLGAEEPSSRIGDRRGSDCMELAFLYWWSSTLHVWEGFLFIFLHCVWPSPRIFRCDKSQSHGAPGTQDSGLQFQFGSDCRNFPFLAVICFLFISQRCVLKPLILGILGSICHPWRLPAFSTLLCNGLIKSNRLYCPCLFLPQARWCINVNKQPYMNPNEIRNELSFV